MTLEQEAAWYEQASTGDGIIFTIYEIATGRPIGNCDIQNLSVRNRRAEIGIVIGEPDARGKGYGTEAVRLLKSAFTALGLHNVVLQVDEASAAARRADEKAGFREIGRRRRASRGARGRTDEIDTDGRTAEVDSPVLGHVFAPEMPRA